MTVSSDDATQSYKTCTFARLARGVRNVARENKAAAEDPAALVAALRLRVAELDAALAAARAAAPPGAATAGEVAATADALAPWAAWDPRLAELLALARRGGGEDGGGANAPFDHRDQLEALADFFEGAATSDTPNEADDAFSTRVAQAAALSRACAEYARAAGAVPAGVDAATSPRDGSRSSFASPPRAMAVPLPPTPAPRIDMAVGTTPLPPSAISSAKLRASAVSVISQRVAEWSSTAGTRALRNALAREALEVSMECLAIQRAGGGGGGSEGAGAGGGGGSHRLSLGPDGVAGDDAAVVANKEHAALAARAEVAAMEAALAAKVACGEEVVEFAEGSKPVRSDAVRALWGGSGRVPAPLVPLPADGSHTWTRGDAAVVTPEFSAALDTASLSVDPLFVLLPTSGAPETVSLSAASALTPLAPLDSRGAAAEAGIVLRATDDADVWESAGGWPAETATPFCGASLSCARACMEWCLVTGATRPLTRRVDTITLGGLWKRIGPSGAAARDAHDGRLLWRSFSLDPSGLYQTRPDGRGRKARVVFATAGGAERVAAERCSGGAGSEWRITRVGDFGATVPLGYYVAAAPREAAHWVTAFNRAAAGEYSSRAQPARLSHASSTRWLSVVLDAVTPSLVDTSAAPSLLDATALDAAARRLGIPWAHGDSGVGSSPAGIAVGIRVTPHTAEWSAVEIALGSPSAAQMPSVVGAVRLQSGVRALNFLRSAPSARVATAWVAPDSNADATALIYSACIASARIGATPAAARAIQAARLAAAGVHPPPPQSGRATLIALRILIEQTPRAVSGDSDGTAAFFASPLASGVATGASAAPPPWASPASPQPTSVRTALSALFTPKPIRVSAAARSDAVDAQEVVAIALAGNCGARVAATYAAYVIRLISVD